MAFKAKVFFIVFLSIFLYGSQAREGASDDVVVHLSVGKLRGIRESVSGTEREAESFYGIPFAEPPIGDLRFVPSKPAKGWSGVRNARKPGARCVYGRVMPPMAAKPASPDSMSEDCLFLNVFRPAGTKATKDLPVMVFIHGGGYYRGSGDVYDGTPLAAYNDVIVVTMNYRLGLLGFLHVAGTDVTGNYAMYDQILALKWVQQHIGCFGGDPSQVTLFGQSAGGASVLLLTLSPLSKGLFKRAILESPTETYGTYPTNNTKVYIDRLGCHGEKVLACLQSKSLEEILKAQGIADFLLLGIVFPVPAVDGSFLGKDPDVMIAEGQVHPLDAVIVGVNSNEGGFHWHGVMETPDSQPSVSMFKESIVNVSFTKQGDCDIVKEAIMYRYTNHTEPFSPHNLLHNWQRLVTEYRFFAPAIRMAQAYVKAGIPTYFYHFSHWSTFSKRPKSVGVVHFDEIPYVFGLPWKPNKGIQVATKYTDVERGLSTMVMRMWGEFAYTGSPMKAGDSPQNVTWPLYSTEQEEYLDIGLQLSVHRKLRPDGMAFWNEFVPLLTKHCQQN